MDVKNIGRNIFPCNVCDFKSEEEQILLDHIKNQHSCYSYTISCLCESCTYKVDDLEEMIDHLKNVHVGKMRKLVQSFINRATK